MLATDLKTGAIFKENETPFVVLKYHHIKVARGGATVRVKAKDLLTGNVYEKSYKSTAKVEDALVSRNSAQYLYEDNGYVFMDPHNYNQFTISKELLGDSAIYLQDGALVTVVYFENNPISVDLPNTMVFSVTYTEPGFKGNTVTNAMKDATLENGLVLKVPPFVKIGDLIKVDTKSGEYVSKA